MHPYRDSTVSLCDTLPNNSTKLIQSSTNASIYRVFHVEFLQGCVYIPEFLTLSYVPPVLVLFHCRYLMHNTPPVSCLISKMNGITTCKNWSLVSYVTCHPLSRLRLHQFWEVCLEIRLPACMSPRTFGWVHQLEALISCEVMACPGSSWPQQYL